jgi:hypothetical protein
MKTLILFLILLTGCSISQQTITDTGYVHLSQIDSLTAKDRFVIHWKSTSYDEWTKYDHRAGKLLYRVDYDYSKLLNKNAKE